MKYNVRLKGENGSIIIIGLLTVALLSLLGLASTTKSQTDISIAGNSRDIEGSLYAAEVAIVFGENSLNELNEYKKLDGININGHIDVGNKQISDYIMPKNSELDWSRNSLQVSGSEIPTTWQDNMSSNPKYIIKQHKFISDCNTIGTNTCENTGIDILKVVARGNGKSEKTSTTLETTVHWRFR